MQPTLAVLPLLLLLCPAAASAVEPIANDPPARAVIASDEAFSRAYNHCATTRLRSMFAVSAEVIAAKEGVTRRIGEVIDNIHRNECGRLRREVDAASIEIRPLPGYGALQFGRERYCPVAGATCDRAFTRFLVIWRQREGDWKITRLVRFGDRS